MSGAATMARRVEARIRLADQLAAHRGGEAMRADRHARLFRELEIRRRLLAARTDANEHDLGVCRVVSADTREIGGQLIFESLRDDLVDARQVLAFPDGARDLLQQAEPLELRV
jgi:hypothetical protein